MSRRAEQQQVYDHQILSAIEERPDISQRTLASGMGIALGMTNLLMRRLVRKGLVRVSRIRANRVSYFLTPRGMAEKARMSRRFFLESVKLYASARARVGARFQELSAAWPERAAQAGEPRRLIFIGTGELAEIAYVCLQETDLQLAGVIDFQGRDRFFGVPVYHAGSLGADARALLAQIPIAVAFSDGPAVQAFLEEAALPPDRVIWI